MAATIRVLDTKAAAKAEVVEEAKRVLSMAERGEIVDLSWSAAKVDGSVISSFTATEDAHMGEKPRSRSRWTTGSSLTRSRHTTPTA
ncbi:hypothetical protein [Agrobacterium tumefaciens]|uniref:hypothetical protein n=1 Tax=Agrobacterium tumefaciens TaxID=358 RepID=UPI002FD896AA